MGQEEDSLKKMQKSRSWIFKMKYSLASLMEVIENELDIGDVFKFPIPKEDYKGVKEHILRSPNGSYQVNKQIEMPNTEKLKEVQHYIIVRRLR